MLFDDRYKTISGSSEGNYKDRGSKFIAIAFPVISEDEVKERLAEVKGAYHDARHHCYAYMIAPDKSVSRYNDDGEPSGTAGRPILGQINSNDLTNVLIVVVRYFGGVKLGVRGLINAYKGATADALANAKIVTKTVKEEYEIQFAYPETNAVMRIMKETNVNIFQQEFALNCLIKFGVRKNEAQSVYERLSKINGLKINYLRTI
ncbi:MAG: YigZ family protein [Bacteroidales bacterium]|nr:YigZ family protein [Bacteroidales bacterium]